MITKQLIKNEIDFIPDQYAEVLYKIINGAMHLTVPHTIYCGCLS